MANQSTASGHGYNPDGILGYQEHNYTLIPCGRVFLDEKTDRFYVCVGSWLHQVDAEKLHELIEDEFNLPIDFEFVEDYHWDLGHGWSEELI